MICFLQTMAILMRLCACARPPTAVGEKIAVWLMAAHFFSMSLASPLMTSANPDEIASNATGGCPGGADEAGALNGTIAWPSACGACA